MRRSDAESFCRSVRPRRPALGFFVGLKCRSVWCLGIFLPNSSRSSTKAGLARLPSIRTTSTLRWLITWRSKLALDCPSSESRPSSAISSLITSWLRSSEATNSIDRMPAAKRPANKVNISRISRQELRICFKTNGINGCAASGSGPEKIGKKFRGVTVFVTPPLLRSFKTNDFQAMKSKPKMNSSDQA